MKFCWQCQKSKDAEEFHKNASKKDGLKSECKSCTKLDIYKRNSTLSVKKAKIKWQKENPDKVWHRRFPEKSKAAMRKHYEENKPKYLEYFRRRYRTPQGWVAAQLNMMKAHAMDRGFDSPEITRKMLLNTIEGPDFKRLWVVYSQKEYEKWMRPSIDRINPNIGYLVSNVRIVTWQENAMAEWDRKRKKQSKKP